MIHYTDDDLNVSSRSLTSLQSMFDFVLQTYGEAKKVPEVRRTVANVLRMVKTLIENSTLLREMPTLQIKYSTGLTRAANIPWVTLRDSRISPRTSEGVECMYLFKANQSSVCLVVGQGAGRRANKLPGRSHLQYLHDRSSLLRPSFECLGAHGFCTDDNLRLNDYGMMSAGMFYEAATIVYKCYQKGEIPSDENLLSDLSACLLYYEKYVSNIMVAEHQ